MGKSLRVLLVEDSIDDAMLLLRELRQGGYDPISERVDTAEAMDEAMEKQSFQEGWDIVIADYVMPSFSGLAALELLKKKGIDLPFIIVSGKIGEDVAVETMKAGAHDYVLKDNLTRLVPAVERELGDAQVRRERRRLEQERIHLLEQLRTVNEKLILTSLQAKESNEEAQRLAVGLDSTINSIADGVMIFNNEGAIVRTNPAVTRMLGYTPADRERPLIELLRIFRAETPDGKPFPADEAPFSRALLGETVRGVLVVLHPPHRDVLWVSVSASPIVGPDGAMLGAVSTLTDVTGLHELQSKIEAYFHAVCPDWQPPASSAM